MSKQGSRPGPSGVDDWWAMVRHAAQSSQVGAAVSMIVARAHATPDPASFVQRALEDLAQVGVPSRVLAAIAGGIAPWLGTTVAVPRPGGGSKAPRVLPSPVRLDTWDRPLYHFTDRRNLDSIFRWGLLSLRSMKNRGVRFWPASSDRSQRFDRAQGLDDYIRLCRQPSHPMATAARHRGSVGQIVWLRIHPDGMVNKHVLFSSKNALHHATEIGPDPAIALDSDDLQAEILVRGHIHRRHLAAHTPAAV